MKETHGSNCKRGGHHYGHVTISLEYWSPSLLPNYKGGEHLEKVWNSYSITTRMLSHCPQTCFVISVAATGPVGPRMISIGHKKENVKRIEVAELAKRLQPALETLRMLGDSCFLLNNEFDAENLFLLYIYTYLFIYIYIYNILLYTVPSFLIPFFDHLQFHTTSWPHGEQTNS